MNAVHHDMGGYNTHWGKGINTDNMKEFEAPRKGRLTNVNQSCACLSR